MTSSIIHKNLEFRFFRIDDQFSYRKYREIKTEVFLNELNWTLPISSDNLVCEDLFDSMSEFLGCYSPDNELIGVTRATSLGAAFPHKEMFDIVLGEKEIKVARRFGFTINAIAIKKPFRGQKLCYQGTFYQTIGSALIEIVFDHYAKLGRKLCLLTAIHSKSDKFFLRNGFRYLGDPFTPSNMNMQLVNMIRNYDNNSNNLFCHLLGQLF